MTTDNANVEYIYLTGFGNEFATEALPNALPKRGNNPQHNAYNLVTEQISGTAFTVPRCNNLRSWLYRKKPSTADIQEYRPVSLSGCDHFCSEGEEGGEEFELNPNPLRWKPLIHEEGEDDDDESECQRKNFVFGLETIAKSKSENLFIHVYNFHYGMDRSSSSLVNSDGDFLIVPQHGSLHIKTELGNFIVDEGEIIVVPRGIVFQVNPNSSQFKVTFGYILEVSGHFSLPELGPIGSNGLANPRDFFYPVACYDKDDAEKGHFNIYNKFGGKLFQRSSNHSPYNVVAWHGNYAPFKYDLAKFNFVNSVSYDHLDPSIFTVLTCPSCWPGTSLADFVVFGPRWCVGEDTFRPPWYHRNCMSEFMGLIKGQYDAKQSGFFPGGASLHPVMTPHGPDCATYQKALEENTEKPTKLTKGQAFMFESREILLVNKKFINSNRRDCEYTRCWSDD